MTTPLYELRDVRMLKSKELIERDNFAITCILAGIDRDGLRTKMHDRGYRFSNEEYTIWRKSAHEILRSQYRGLELTDDELRSIGLL